MASHARVSLIIVAAAAGAILLALLMRSRDAGSDIPVDDPLRARLSALQFHVTQRKGTERAFSGEFWNNERQGIYRCICCDAPLFESRTKFKSGTGWPSFWMPMSDDSIGTQTDTSGFMVRTEVTCSHCDAHLGHVFKDGPEPTGLRYCINSAALDFVEATPQNDSTAEDDCIAE